MNMNMEICTLLFFFFFLLWMPSIPLLKISCELIQFPCIGCQNCLFGMIFVNPVDFDHKRSTFILQ